MLNSVQIQGRLTRDPDVRRTQNGTAVASFTVACDRNYSSNGERETDFISCVAWRQSAEFLGKYWRKGQEILLTGSLQVRSYQKDGTTFRVTEVVADHLYFCGSKADRDEDDYARAEKAGKQMSDKPAGAPVNVEYDEDEGDLPFD